VSFTFALEGDLLRVVGQGRLPAAEVQAGFRGALAGVQLPPNVRVLWDFRSVPTLDLSSDQVRALRSIAAEADLHELGARLAWVASADVVYGIGCMFRAMAAVLPLEVEVFRGLAQASEWLDASATHSAPNGGGHIGYGHTR
jgi:hypothetical protein